MLEGEQSAGQESKGIRRDYLADSNVRSELLDIREGNSHAELQAAVDAASRQKVLLRLQASVADVADTHDKEEHIAKILEDMEQAEQDARLLELMSSHHTGFGRIEGVQVTEKAFRALQERYPEELGSLESRSRTVYVHERFIGDLADDERGFVDPDDERGVVPIKDADFFKSKSGELKSKYQEVSLVEAVVAKVDVDQSQAAAAD